MGPSRSNRTVRGRFDWFFGLVFFGIMASVVLPGIFRILLGPVGRVLAVLLPLGILGLMFLGFRRKKRYDETEISRVDLHEFDDHIRQGPGSIGEFFASEAPGSDYYLPVAVHGKAVCAAPLTSPVSGRPAVAWRLVVATAGARKGRRHEAQHSSPAVLRWVPFSLEDGEKGLAVIDRPIIHGRSRVEEVYSPSRFQGLPASLRELISECLGSAGISWAGKSLLVREERIEPGTWVTAYGIARKPGEEPVLTGSDSVDDPGSLYVTDVAPDERRRRIEAIRSRMASRRRAFRPAAGLLILASVAFLILPVVLKEDPRVGPAAYRDLTEDLQFEISGFQDEEQGTITWNLSPTTGGDTEFLLHDGEPVSVSPESHIVVRRIDHEEGAYTLGVGPARWEGDAFEFILPAGFPPKAQGPVRAGGLLVQNASNRTVELAVFDARGSLLGSTRTMGPTGDGSVDLGLVLEEGSRIELSVAGVRVRRFLTGRSREPVWSEEDGGQGYVLSIDDGSLAPRRGRLFMKNPTDFGFRVEILNPDGTRRYDTTWVYRPGEDMDRTRGSFLSFQGEAVTVLEGDIVRLGRRSEPTTIYEGRLDEYPGAEWDRDEGLWVLRSRG